MVLTRRQIKWVAALTMLIDHMTFRSSLVGTTHPVMYSVGRGIGRIAFPLYALMFVDSLRYTSSPNAYVKRLFIMGLVSEIPYNVMLSEQLFYTDSQNILFLFAIIGYFVSRIFASVEKDGHLVSFANGVRVILAVSLPYVLGIDYGATGALYLLLLVGLRYDLFGMRHKKLALYIGTVILTGGRFVVSLLIVVIMSAYDKQAKSRMTSFEQRFHYVFYPLHMGLISVLIG